MKCINCGTDNNLKDRTATSNNCCKKCGHEFTFEPTTMGVASQITDTFFQNLIESTSFNNTLYFNNSQLYYSLISRLQYRHNSNQRYLIYFLVVLAVLYLLGAIFQNQNLEGTAAGFILFISITVFSNRRLARWNPNPDRHILLKKNEFDRHLDRWIRINGKPEKLLPLVENAPTVTVPNSEVRAGVRFVEV